MKIYFLTILLVFGFAQSQQNCDKSKIENSNKTSVNKKMPKNTPEQTKFDKLPDGVSLTDEVREETKNENGEVSYKIITVEEKLKEIGAKYSGEKLVDKNGKEIKFYKPPIRGASQGFEEDQKQQKRDEEQLKSLKEKYTVIILYENPLKVV